MTTITLKFFAQLREQTGVEALQVPMIHAQDLTALKAFLVNEHPQWEHLLNRQLMMAVNQNMVSENMTLNAGDEVALFPPVTGG